MWKIIIISLVTIAVINLINIERRNLIIALLCFELLFFAIAVGCVCFFYTHGFIHFGNYDLLFGAIAITVVAAAESVVGLALIALLHGKSKSIKVKKFNRM